MTQDDDGRAARAFADDLLVTANLLALRRAAGREPASSPTVELWHRLRARFERDGLAEPPPRG